MGHHIGDKSDPREVSARLKRVIGPSQANSWAPGE
ncbi:hypothetical protein P4S64_15285 [Vibrio sp. M60_M31a]